VRNEERYIAKCIDSIVSSDLPYEEFELLVVDGMSTDDSRTIICDRAGAHGNVRLIDNLQRTTPVGLNLGVRNARGKYIVILGAHCEYPKDYLSQCVHELERTGADVVGGMLVTRPGADTLIARAIASATVHPFGVGNSDFRIGRGGKFVDTVPYGMYRREVFDRVGLFREDLIRNQDFELNARIRAAGGRLYLCDRQVTYFNVPTFSAFVRQGFNKGAWVARSWCRSSVSLCIRHMVPAAFVAGLLSSFIAGLFYAPAAGVGLTVLALYIMLAIASSIEVAIQSGWRLVYILPLLFFSYHLVYGAGTFVGLVLGSKGESAPSVTVQSTTSQNPSSRSHHAT
jgi:glycosyltransferase involved in cell wall biosynthesis